MRQRSPSATCTRALLQPDGFEGLVRVPVDPYSGDTNATREIGNNPARLIEPETAATPTRVDASNRDDPVGDGTHVVEMKLPLRELLVDVAYPLLEAGVASIRLASSDANGDSSSTAGSRNSVAMLRSPAFQRSMSARISPTFSCDTAYASKPTALRASCHEENA